MTLRLAVLFVVAAPLSVLAVSPSASAAPDVPERRRQARVTPEQALDALQKRLDAGLLDAKGKADALKVTKAVLEQDPTNIKARLLTAEVLLEEGPDRNFDAARTHFRLVLEVEPSNFRANRGLGKIWVANRAWRQASSYLENAERVAPAEHRAEVKLLLAITYSSMGNAERAIEKAVQAVQEDPDDLDALHTLIGIRQSLVDHSPQQIEAALTDAERYIKKATEAVEEMPWERKRLARLSSAYQLERGVMSAYLRSLYQRNVHNQPTDQLQPGREADAAALLIRMAEKTRLQAALQSALVEHDVLLLTEKAAEYEPDNIRYLEALVSAYRRVKNRDQAIETCRKVLQLNANHAEARQYLQAQGVAVSAATAAPASSGNPAD